MKRTSSKTMTKQRRVISQRSSGSGSYSDFTALTTKQYELLRTISLQNSSVGSSGHSTVEFDTVTSGGSVDVESQQASNKSLSRSEPMPPGRRRVKTRRTRRSATSSNICSVLLRKIVAVLLADLDDETLQRDDTETILVIVTLLKEAMVGIIIAFLLVSFILFIDHRFLLNLPTASNFRKATFAVMNDRETLRNFEENSGFKFVDRNDYEGMLLEISKAENKTKLAAGILKSRSGDLVGIKEEFEVVKAETPRMMSSLGLDKFCDIGESCMWGGKMTCAGRVEWLQTQHQGVTKYQAMMSAMQNEACKQKPTATKMNTQEERKVEVMLYKVNFMLKDWDNFENQFYPDGKWSQDVSCSEQADYLAKRNTGKSIDRAMAMLMAESQTCRNLFYEEEIEKMERFCKDCKWDENMTCGQRVVHLKYRNQYTERTATLMAIMERPLSCAKKQFCKECKWDDHNMTCGQRVEFLKYRDRCTDQKAMLVAMERPSCARP